MRTKFGKWNGIKFNPRYFSIWLAARLLLSRENSLASSAPLAMAGLILGVSVLFVSQAVMTGFEKTLQKAMIDVTSDLQVIKTGRLIESWDDFSKELKEQNSEIQSLARFSYAEAVAANKGKVSGVLLQGMNKNEIDGVLNLKKRILHGQLPSETHEVAIGKGLAKKFHLEIGQSFYLAVPLSTPLESNQFRRRAQEVKVSGIVDLGKNEWNERLILAHLEDLQILTEIGDRYTGAFVKLSDSNRAVPVTHKMIQDLGPRYRITNWYDLNRNLFEAVGLEKVVIFFVVFLIVLVAAFNISSSLNVIIRSRSRDIAILKTLGFSNRRVHHFFVWQGVWVGFFGTLGGFLLGLCLIGLFGWMQGHFNLIAGTVYKVDVIDASIGWVDMLSIFAATCLVCALASWGPAKQASRLTVVEGLRST